jgi:hypothetical protein
MRMCVCGGGLCSLLCSVLLVLFSDRSQQGSRYATPLSDVGCAR